MFWLILILIVTIIAFPQVLWICLGCIAAIVALSFLFSNKNADNKQTPSIEDDIRNHPNAGRIITYDYHGVEVTERVGMVVDVPPPDYPPVSIEKTSKIVSIFDKKWFDIAMKEFIVVDLETTGLYKEYDRIVEISAIRYQYGKEVDNFTTLIDPCCKIPYPAMCVHKITDEMVAGSPLIEQILPPFLKYLGDSLLVAHNAHFDIGFIEVWARRLRYDPRWSYVDTISVAKRILPELPNYKQQTILDAIGYTQNEYHRAEADCRGCAEIMLLGINSTVGAS